MNGPVVFISYRRDDSGYVADIVRDHLLRNLAGSRIFMDVDDIPLGRDFRVSIEAAIQECSILLALIGNDWIGERGEGHEPRLFDASDFVRIEIEAALARAIPAIPVLVRDARLPDAASLPESLRPLCYRQAAEVRAGPFLKAHLAELSRRLAELHQTVAIQPRQSADQTIPNEAAHLDKRAAGTLALFTNRLIRNRVRMLIGFGLILAAVLAVLATQSAKKGVGSTPATVAKSGNETLPPAASQGQSESSKASLPASLPTSPATITGIAPSAEESGPSRKQEQKPFIRMTGTCTRDSTSGKYHVVIKGTSRLPAGGRFRYWMMGGQDPEKYEADLLCPSWQYSKPEMGCFRSTGDPAEGRWTANFWLDEPRFNSGNHLVVPALVYPTRTGGNYIAQGNVTVKCPE